MKGLDLIEIKKKHVMKALFKNVRQYNDEFYLQVAIYCVFISICVIE